MKSETSTSRTAMSALHLLHRAGQRADELFAEVAERGDITPRQFAVLRAVADSEEPSQTVLVEKTGIDRSTLADIVRRMVERGLIQRKRTKQDARMYAVRLTASGQSALKSMDPVARKSDDRLLSPLSSQERDAFLKALRRIVDTSDEGKS